MFQLTALQQFEEEAYARHGSDRGLDQIKRRVDWLDKQNSLPAYNYQEGVLFQQVPQPSKTQGDLLPGNTTWLRTKETALCLDPEPYVLHEGRN
jgi:hypothetical protein